MKRLLALGLAVISSLVFVAIALAGHGGAPTTTEFVQPTVITGNVNACPAGNEFQLNLDWDAGEVTVGVHGFIEITNVNAQAKTFDWELVDPTAVEENVIFVKGGPNTNKYDYTNPPIDATGDTGLHAPVNHNNNKYYGLSHILFCFDPKDPPR